MAHRSPSVPAGPTHEAGLQRLVRSHEGPLRRLHERGAREHAPLPLAFETFARRALHAARAGTDAPGQVGHALDRLAGEDLYLAVLCDEGVPRAWEVLLARYLPRLTGLLKHHGASEEQAEDVLRELPGELTTPPARGGARTRIGTFEGTASLFSWLAVIVLRRFADRLRAPAQAFADPDRDQERRGTAPDPADLFLEEETARRFGDALRLAWATLTPREALALAFKFRQGVPQRTMARLLGVGEARVSRLVHTGIARLKAAIEERGGDLGEAGTDPARGWAALIRIVREHLQSTADPSDSPGERPGD